MKILYGLCALLLPLTLVAQDDTAKCGTPEHMAFDFWVGEWQVTNPDGKPAGQNTIDKIEGGCVLRENWRSATSGFTGTSYNFYNQRDERWEQLWLDNNGGFLKLAGNRKDNQMVLESAPAPNDQGADVVQRITWTANEDGSVRQYWETITGGDQIQVAFDGLYRKAK